MQTITITDEELHELVECLEYRVYAYRNSNPPPKDDGIAWINRYESRNKVLIEKLQGKLNAPECDPYHMKQVVAWNKRLDELLAENKALKNQLTSKNP